MKTLAIISLLIFAVPIAAACEPPRGMNRTSDKAEAISLDEFKWENRVVLLFAPGPKDSDYHKQQEAFAEAKTGLRARDIVVVTAFADGSGMLDGRPIDQKSVRALRRDFQPVSGALTFVLVGKDGTEKMRVKGRPTKVEKIFETIDAMPMRQQEMEAQEEAAGK